MALLASLLLAALGGPAALAAAKDEPADPAARLYLTWHAPYGKPGATTNLTLAAGDTTREDTLYLTCEPAVDSPMLRGLTANLMVHAAPGDSLPPYWRFAHGGQQPAHVRPRVIPDSTVTMPIPWKPGYGVSAVGYDYGRVMGRMALVIAVPTARVDSLRAGTRYLLSRILFRHPPAGLAGLDRPVCIEWLRGKLSLTAGRDIVIEQGDRFASWNSPGCAVCERFRGPLAPRVWQPRPRP